MKSLPTLLKIARRDLDVLRRALADQIAKRIAIDERIRTHEQSILAEQKIALRDYEGTRAYGGFASLAVSGRRALEAEAAAVDQESERLRMLITEAHVEMRKFERLIELQEERERKEAAKRQDAELDEMATLRVANRPSQT
ncbi:MAG: hypothetical protein ABUL42_00830 [Terricaulis silvestris]